MRRFGVCVTGVVLGALLLGGVATGVGAAQTEDPGANTSFGGELSSFMQASETETEGELEEGMFNATLNRTKDPEMQKARIEERKQVLEERQQELHSQREGLNDGPDVRARAVATRVAIASRDMEESADRIDTAAKAVGVDMTGLGRIKSNASELRSSEVTDRAPEIAEPPETAERGPPEEILDEDREAEKRHGENTTEAIGRGGKKSKPGNAATNRTAGEPGKFEKAESSENVTGDNEENASKSPWNNTERDPPADAEGDEDPDDEEEEVSENVAAAVSSKK